MSFGLPPWLLELSAVASLLGFCITVLILFQTWEIKRVFLRRKRLPEIVRALSAAVQDLEGFLSYDADVARRFADARGLLESALPNEKVKDMPYE
jgi:hypothetical protein